MFAGWLFYDKFVGETMEAFWGASVLFAEGNEVPHHAHDVPLWVKLAPLVVGIAGIAIAYLFYMFKTDLPGKLAGAMGGLYRFLLNKWYFDELFDRVFVFPAQRIGYGLWRSGDGAVIDGLGPDGVASATLGLARRARALQSGYLYHYVFAMLIGLAVVVSWFLFRLWG